MSTLEKIRKRPAIVISVIGFAIVLFIVTAVVTSFDIFTDHESAAKVDGEKIKQESVSNLASTMGNNGAYNAAYEQALQRLIAEQLLSSHADEIGLVVTDREMEDYLFKAGYIRPEFQQLAEAVSEMSGTEIQSMTALYNYVNSNSDLQGAWKSADAEARKNLLIEKYLTLMSPLGNVNVADARNYYDNAYRTANIRYVVKDVSTLDDKDFALTAEEVAEYYKANKELFKIKDEQRLVNYIALIPEPSDADVAKGRADVKAALEGLRTRNGLAAVESSSKFEVVPMQGSASTLNRLLTQQGLYNWINYINALTDGSSDVMLLDKIGNQYVMGKVLGVESGKPEFAMLDVIVPQPGKADEVIAGLNQPDSISTTDANIITKQLGQETPVSYLSEGVPELWTLLRQNEGEYVKFNDPRLGGEAIYRIASYSEPTDIYDLALVSYTIEPSNETLAAEKSRLADYVAANAKAADFVANAKAAGLTVNNVRIDGSDLTIDHVPGSAPAAYWVMDNDKGDVNPNVYEDDEHTVFLAVAVGDVYDSEYVAANDPDVKKFIAGKIRNEKKAAQLLNEYKGKASDLEGYAEAMGASVQMANGVNNIAGTNVGGIAPNDPYFYAQFANAKKGELVGPFATTNGIVVFEIVEEGAGNPREFDFNVDRDAAARSIHSPKNQFELLRGDKEIEYTFQRWFGER